MSNGEKSNTNTIVGFSIGIILVIIACYYAYTNGNAYNKHYWIAVNTSDDMYLTFEDVTHVNITNRSIRFQYKDDDYTFRNVRGYQKHPLEK